jgi:transcription antitermination protein NusB
LKKSTKPVQGPDLTPIDAELDIDLLPKIEEENGDAGPEFKLQTRRDERQLALCLLYALDRTEYSVTLEDVVKRFEQGFDFKIPRKSFTMALVTGVSEDVQVLDEQLKPYLKNWRLERLGGCTHLILRMALWELRQPKAIASIVINEAVELAKTFAEKDAYRFVNGILDEIAKTLLLIIDDSNQSKEPGK